jgi:hypothetical protein
MSGTTFLWEAARGQGLLLARRSFVTITVLLIMLCLTGCGDDGADVPSCPLDGIDPRLVGDWMRCDENGNYFTMGTSVAMDGRRTPLGVDWTTGRVAVSDQACGQGVFRCLGDGRIAEFSPPGETEYTYEVEGDRLTLTPDGLYAPSRYYRRIQLGQYLEHSRSFRFNYVIDSIPGFAPAVWSSLPAQAQLYETGGKMQLDITAAGRHSFIISIHGFEGPGRYVMKDMGQPTRAQYITGCPDILEASATTDDGQSTVTITKCDIESGRCRGHFSFVFNHYAWIAPVLATGSFDIPLSEG